MSSIQVRSESAIETPKASPIDMKLEVIVIPVADVERATQFYSRVGWRQDVTPPGSGVVQFTPQGSGMLCSIRNEPDIGRSRIRPENFSSRLRHPGGPRKIGGRRY